MEEKEIGDYRIVRLLGKGGMGAVYEVENKDGERLALKSFTSSGAHADFLRKRFVAEGKILSLLDSPYLVKVHETGFDRKTGVPYFTMDLVLSNDGEPCTLENLRTQGGLDEWKIAALYENLCCALAYLHSKGIVHRDVKLENVLIDAEGRVVLSDFGVSRILDVDLRNEFAVTTTFAADRAPIMGSAGYLSPELKTGAAATPADDAWALGVLVFRLLTGVWYEEDSSAMELVEGFDLGWRGVFSVLLDADPSRRLPLPAVNKRRDTRLKFVFGVVAAVAVFVGVACFFLLSSPEYKFDDFFPPLQEESGK